MSRSPARLRKERTALVIIDLQARLVPAIHEKERVVQNSLLLMRLAEVLGVPVVLTSQYRKGLGEIVPEIRSAASDVEPIDKVSFGCFDDPTFLAHLEGLGREQLVVTGVESHICVMQTVLGALERGYEVHVAQDAVGARTAANWQVGLSRMERAGALLSSAEMASYELLSRSDTEAFKRMLPHLKA